MSKFYGWMTSDAIKTAKTCRSHRYVKAAVRSWEGSAIVQLSDTPDGPMVELRVGHGSTTEGYKTVFSALLSDLLNDGTK